MNDWLKIAIPKQKSSNSALDYHQIPIDINGAANNELLIAPSRQGVASKSIYARAVPPYNRAFSAALPEVYVRTTVGEKLSAVNAQLRPYGAELLLLDGFRPIQLQRELWDHFIEEGKHKLINPTDEQLVTFAGQFCSDPRGFDADDFRTWPVHNTGGAIDLTLIDCTTKLELNMGGIFDDASEVSSTRYYENSHVNQASDSEARDNRRLLYHAMSVQGFVNYHHEWWHYDFGTQMWVMNGGLECHALYGKASLPT